MKNNFGRSTISKKPNDTMKLLVTTFMGIVFGFTIGITFPILSLNKIYHPVDIAPVGKKFSPGVENNSSLAQNLKHLSQIWVPSNPRGAETHPPDIVENNSSLAQNLKHLSQIWVPSNPRGAETLPPDIVASESDFYLHRLWGNPSEDLTIRPKYLVTFTVGISQKKNIDAAVKKLSENFTIVLFHYDGKTSEWDEFEWSKRAVHVRALKQTKWWYAKRFLHPDVVAAYEYVFIWDEDLGVEHFNAEEYIKLVKKHGLEISQPGLEPNHGLVWQMTKRLGDKEVHKTAEEKSGWCSDRHQPPCAGFVEIMAPVFSRNAWRCVWHLIQNDLIHGWGLDFALQRCVEPAHQKIGVVDAQWIVHQTVPSLGNQGEAADGQAPWRGVRKRCRREWKMFQDRLKDADKAYYKSIGIDPPKSTVR